MARDGLTAKLPPNWKPYDSMIINWHRETPPCNKNKLTYLYRDAIEQLTKK